MKLVREIHQHAFANTPVSKVVRGGGAAFAIHVAAAGTTYCSQLLIARMVGVESFGVYAYVTAIMVVLAYFAALGFDVALLRFVPAYEAQRRWDLLNGVICYAQRRVSAVGIAIILIGISVVLSREVAMSPELRSAFLVGLLLVPVWSLLWIRCSAIRAFGGVVWSIAPDRLVREGMVIGLVGLATMGAGLRVGAAQVIAAALFSSGIGLALTSFAMRRLRPTAANSVEPRYDAAAWRPVALPLLIIGATEALMNRTGVLILGWFGDIKGAGIYSLALNIALVVVLPRAAINTLFAPAISRLFTRSERTTLQLLIASAASWTFFAAGGIALVLALLAEPLLAWFGPGLKDGVTALRILLLAQTLAAGAGSQMYVMTMTGHERSAAALLALSAFTSTVASVALIPHFGLVGASIATSAGLILWNAAMALFLWRRMRLLPGVLAMLRSPIEEAGGAERADALP